MKQKLAKNKKHGSGYADLKSSGIIAPFGYLDCISRPHAD